MKRFRFLLPLIAAVCMIGMSACGSGESSQTASSAAAVNSAAEASVSAALTKQSQAEGTQPAETQSSAAEEAPVSKTEEAASLPEQQTEPVSEAEPEPEEPEEPAPEETKPESSGSVIVYFSATGTTKGVAERLANVTGADLFEIIPAEPYSDADLDWNDLASRTTKEMADPDVRPEIANDTIDLDGYSTIYLGYPIWWGEAPRIMSTFVEAHSFEGKTVVPFCTSGSSPVGRSAVNLSELSTGGSWKDGSRLEATISEELLQKWIADIG